jgi:hypothetical protein
MQYQERIEQPRPAVGGLRFTIRDMMWLTLVAALAAGWGVDRWFHSRPIGSVEGLITLDGQPIADGSIKFHGVSQSVGAKSRPDGEFLIPLVPTGQYRITIEGRGLPQKYSAENQSALTAVVSEGMNVFHFELRSR